MYAPLPSLTSTRLLKIFPGDPSDNIIASLEEVDLESRPDYECLSYTWGTSTDESSILIDNITVAIRRNLYSFLHKLRSPHDSRTVWVDAICISQSDLDEKAQQVAMIGRIFNQAARVSIWLGESAEDSDILFQATSGDRPFWRRALGTQPSSAVIKQRVTIWNAFLARPYWRRTWIVQEVICAKAITVHCGADHAEWESLITPRVYRLSGLSFDGISLVSSKLEKAAGTEAANQFKGNVQIIERLANSRWSYWQGREIATPGHQIIYLCPSFADNKSFDRLDKIYAMLSLEPEQSFRDAVGVDYKISVSQLFARALKALEKSWNCRLAASSLVRIFNMSQQEASELLEYLTANHGNLSTGGLDYLERYAREGVSAPFSDPPCRAPIIS